MPDALRQVQPLPILRDPVVVVGFAVRQRGGRLAHEAFTSLVDAWQAKLVAEIECDDFFDTTVRRPTRRSAEGEASIEWPKIEAYVASPPGASHDFLLLGGFEPHFRWPALGKLIGDYLDAAGVRTVISLRSFPGSVPHTRPAPVNLTASDIELEVQFGIQAETSKYEGPGDFASTLGARAEALGWRTVELSVIVPYYFRPMPTAAATLSLIKVLDHAFSIETPTGTLQASAADEARDADEKLADNEEARSMVVELERTYDEGLDRIAFLSPGAIDSTTLPPGAELADDIERFFREGGSPRE